MLRVTIELIPASDPSNPRKLGEILIANTADGTPTHGNYEANLMKSAEYAKTPGIWKKATVTGFPRQRLGPYDLLFRVLRSAVGGRNG